MTPSIASVGSSIDRPIDSSIDDGRKIPASGHASQAGAIESALQDDADSEGKRGVERAGPSARDLKQIFDVTTDSIVCIDREWNCTFANRAAHRILKTDDLVGLNLWTDFPGNNNEPFASNYRRTMEQRVATEFEAYYPAPLNIWFRVSATPFDGEGDAAGGMLIFSNEITGQKRAEAALIQSEKLAAVGRLASSISHEINNPLEAITNLLYLIQQNESMSEDLRYYVNAAQSELARVCQIATQTLRFHRQAVRAARVTAQELVRAVIQLYQGRLANSGIEVREQYRAQMPVLCFENDIRQVLNNLIANAIDAMRQGGLLFVRSHDGMDFIGGTPRRGVRITIADTGTGMPEAVRRRVFEPFYTTKDLNGTGLGLWISEGIIARHHGSIRLRSSENGAGRGTVFSIFLPHLAETEIETSPPTMR